MDAVDLTGIVQEVPACPVCGMGITVNEVCVFAQAEGYVFLVHEECSDFEFWNA